MSAALCGMLDSIVVFMQDSAGSHWQSVCALLIQNILKEPEAVKKQDEGSDVVAIFSSIQHSICGVPTYCFDRHRGA